MEAQFLVKDKSGRGFTAFLSSSELLEHWENEDDNMGWLLHDFVEDSTTGDIWEDHATQIVNISN